MKILIFILFILINIISALKCFNLCNNDITIQVCSEEYFKVDNNICKQIEMNIIQNAITNSSNSSFKSPSSSIITQPSPSVIVDKSPSSSVIIEPSSSSSVTEPSSSNILAKSPSSSNYKIDEFKNLNKGSYTPSSSILSLENTTFNETFSLVENLKKPVKDFTWILWFLFALLMTLTLFILLVKKKLRSLRNKVLPVDPKQVIINFKRPKDYFLEKLNF